MFVSAAPLSAPPLTHKRQLAAWLETGARPAHFSAIATGCELFLFDRDTLAPTPYLGDNSLATLLDELQAFKWQPMIEGGALLGLKRDHAQITLGPGGQLGYLGALQSSLHDTAAELAHYFDEVGSVCRVLNMGALGIGFQPKAKREHMPRIPRQRDHIIAAHMPETGSLGLDMMARTASIQATFDFADERDMVAKMRVALSLQPLVGVLFATSPFRDGHPSGDLSFRNRVWQHTDPTRCSYLEFVFSDGFGFEAYVDWALSVPMSYVKRNGPSFDVTGASFVDFMNGRLQALPGEQATIADWINHLSTLTPPVRLDRFIEMRGADMGGYPMTLALPALWTGLLYDPIALDEATQLTHDWTAFDRMQMYTDGPKLGLESRLAGRTVHAIAADVLAIAQRGLARRAHANDIYADETHYLAPLHAILDYGLTHAEELRRRYLDDWSGEIDPVFHVCRVA